MAKKKSSKSPTKNQTNDPEKQIDIIMKEANGAIAELTNKSNCDQLSNEAIEKIYTLFRTGKIVLLRILDRNIKMELVNIMADQAITSGIKNPSLGKTIDCLKGKEHIEGELDKCISHDICFPFLFLDYLDIKLFDGGITGRLLEFRKKLTNEYGSYFTYPPPIIISFIGQTPDIFKNIFYGEFVEIPPSLTEPNVEVGKEGNDKETIRFPTPLDAKWTDVEMYLIDKDHFKIIIKSIKKVATYSQMGFKKVNSTKKTQLWSVLLRFAMANNSPVGYHDEKSKVEKDIQRLNDALIKYFGITGNPIKYQSNKKGYIAGFKIYDDSHLKEHMDSKTQAISEEEKLDEEIDNSFS